MTMAGEPFTHVRATRIDLWTSISATTPDGPEREAARLWIDEAGTDAIAAALGLAHLATDEQRREVKRFKDRLLKRLSRYFRSFDGRP
jgi:hypothetical protein